MTDKNHNNNFRFALYMGDQLVANRIFSADEFNPVTRYSVNIKPMIPRIINELQWALSRKEVTTVDNGYNLFDYYAKIVDDGDVPYEESKLFIPEIKTYSIGSRKIRGVEFTFGLYINKNTIVERNFYVDRYNPESRFSVELTNTINQVTDSIYDNIREADINQMWEDYSLINTYGIYINSIRELSYKKRQDLLQNISDPEYVKKTRRYYRSSQSKSN